MTQENKTQIIIALIGLAGVVLGALFANWDKVFKDEIPSNVEVKTDSTKRLDMLFSKDNYDSGEYLRQYSTQQGKCSVKVREKLDVKNISISSDKTSVNITFYCNRPDHTYDCGGGWTPKVDASYKGRVTANLGISDSKLIIKSVTDHRNNEERSCGSIIVQHLKSLNGTSL